MFTTSVQLHKNPAVSPDCKIWSSHFLSYQQISWPGTGHLNYQLKKRFPGLKKHAHLIGESLPQLHYKEKYIYLSRAPASLRIFLEELIMGSFGGGRSCASCERRESSEIKRQEAGVCIWKVSGKGLGVVVEEPTVNLL